MNKTKPFAISKRSVWEAYKRVKSNKGSAGVDGQSLAQFEENESNNLYKLWNRLASGSYFPKAVKAVKIPKSDGGERVLGVPTVSDRIAQTVAVMALEPDLEKVFHADSYGYRPGRSAHQALAVTRQRCWDYDWVLEYDIRGLFDNIDHDLLFKALRRHTSEKWILLYVERWLTAPMQVGNDELLSRDTGTPQGGPLSPLLANLFLHYALDSWLVRSHPTLPFCRYADDGIVHCHTLEEAQELLVQLGERLNECGLELHPQKTRIVYCKDVKRKRDHDEITFDFLGYTFRPRSTMSSSGVVFVGFNPAVSRAALKKMKQSIRRWKLQLKSYLSLEELSNAISPIVRGWFNYYGYFRKSALQQIAAHLDSYLIRWAMRKFKRLKRHASRARRWLLVQRNKQPGLFPHWV